jgi:MFS family permease
MLMLGYYQRLDIPKRVWQLQIGAVLNAVGTGSTIPFLMLYLSRGRGFSIATAGLLVGTIALTSVAVIPFVGRLIDRWGPKRILVTALVLLVVSFLGFVAVRQPWQAAGCSVLVGMGNACLWPSNALMMTTMLGPEKRHVAFAVERSAANLGLGLGALVGGVLIATIGYVWLFLIDAASFALYLALVLRLGAGPHEGGEPDGRPAAPPSFVSLLRIGPLRRMTLLKFVLVLSGFGPFEVLALFARDRADVNAGLIGLVFLCNTLVIVACQLPLAGALPGRSRMRVLAAVALLWAVTWGIVALADASLTGLAAAGVLMLVAALFGLGEAVQAPAQDPLFIELAPEGALGRAMALSGIAFQGALALGASVGGWFLQHAPHALWPCASALALCSGLLALVWEGSLPSDARLTAARKG